MRLYLGANVYEVVHWIQPSAECGVEMTTDLVTRLRGMSNAWPYQECADEIERLRQKNERLQQQVEFLLEQVRKLKNDNV